ncbi:hypothetical protein ACFU8W_32440 [Streptomyces sp. NPDC057565]|uniref:hypothetical protein n=1 Tax=Streptomyces sp. NPDC057565 TaxID=3346169 RepID=UPI0036A3181A
MFAGLDNYTFAIPGVIAAVLWSFLYVPGISPLVDLGKSTGVDVDFLSADVILFSIGNVVTWSWTGYNMLILYTSLRSVPQELRIFFTIALRLMSPALVTIFLFQFVEIWNNFFLPLMMLADDLLWPLTLGLYFWNSQLRDQPWYDIVVTGSLISVVPLIIAFLTLHSNYAPR